MNDQQEQLEVIHSDVDNNNNLPAKKVDPLGKTFYGEGFERYNRIAEIVDLIPSFKDWYYDIKIKSPNATSTSIIRSFNEKFCVPCGRTFYPYGNQYRSWRAKWDLDIMGKNLDKDIELTPDKKIKQIIKTRNSENNVMIGGIDDADLEEGVKTLGGELMNDAFQMLKDDQQLDDIHKSNTLIQRRNYILNVFGHVTKLVHGKAALVLKASEEKRNNANFLMTLLAQATAGKMSEEQISLLRNNYKPKEGEQTKKR